MEAPYEGVTDMVETYDPDTVLRDIEEELHQDRDIWRRVERDVTHLRRSMGPEEAPQTWKSGLLAAAIALASFGIGYAAAYDAGPATSGTAVTQQQRDAVVPPGTPAMFRTFTAQS
jgi:hypothetical protein